MSEDRDLLKRYAAGRSEVAFAQYVQRHIGFVYATALRATYGDAHTAADVCQQVFVKVARESGRLAVHDAPLGWLFVSTRNTARTFLRSEQTRRKHEQAFSAQGDTTAPDAPWETLRPFLDEAVAALDARDREAVLLRFFENHAFAEIGSRLGLTENAARMRVERALDKLHGILAARGVVSTAAAIGLTVSAHAGATVPGGLAAGIAITAHAAAAHAAVGTGILTLMSTSKNVTLALVTLTIVSTTACIHQWNAARLARKSADAAYSQTLILEEKLRAASYQLHQIEKRTAARLAAETSPESAAPSGPSRRTVVATGSASSPAPAPNPFASPAYVEASQRKFTASLALRYGPLYRKLGLTPEQIAAFERVFTENNQSVLDIWAEAAQQGLSLKDPSIIKMTSGPNETAEAGLRALLGAQFETYQEYGKTLEVRSLVTTLAGNIYYTDSPLQAAQGERLAEVIAINTQQKKRPLVTDRAGQMIYRTYTETNWDNVRQAAQSVLSPAQLQALQSLIQEHETNAALQALGAGTAPGAAR